MLAMIPNDDGLVNSNFLITLKPLRILHGKRVVNIYFKIIIINLKN